jgi:hypothetical protein
MVPLAVVVVDVVVVLVGQVGGLAGLDGPTSCSDCLLIERNLLCHTSGWKNFATGVGSG